MSRAHSFRSHSEWVILSILSKQSKKLGYASKTFSSLSKFPTLLLGDLGQFGQKRDPKRPMSDGVQHDGGESTGVQWGDVNDTERSNLVGSGSNP